MSVPKKDTLDEILERQFCALVPNRILTGPEWIAIKQSIREWLQQERQDLNLNIDTLYALLEELE